jgi:hypothetical protein
MTCKITEQHQKNKHFKIIEKRYNQRLLVVRFHAKHII